MILKLLPIAVLLVLVLTISCKKNPVQDENEFLFTTNLGSQISLNGIWNSGCVTDNDQNLSEVFRFSDNNLKIHIDFFADSNCANSVGSISVNIEFDILGLIDVEVDGQTVSANKISGVQTIENQEEGFKQTIYIMESGSELFLYHARFGDDGGQVSADGFPVEIIPIPIQKVSE